MIVRNPTLLSSMSSSPLDSAFQRYKREIEAVSTSSKPPSRDEALEVLHARDVLEETLKNKGTNVDAPLQDKILVLDRVLEGQSNSFNAAIDLATWREGLPQTPVGWWWYLDTPLLVSYERAVQALATELARNTKSFPSHAFLDILLARDTVEKMLVQRAILSIDQVERLATEDEHLRQYQHDLVTALKPKLRRQALVCINRWKELYRPAESAWWWFPNWPINSWDRWDAVWNGVALVWLTATLSILADISARFLGGDVAPGLAGSFALVLQSLLALIGGGALTQPGRAFVDTMLERLNIPQHWWQEIKMFAAALLFALFVIFHQSLPYWAQQYNNAAVRSIRSDDFGSAEDKLKLAISLNSDYEDAYYNLGSLYEELLDFERAREQYQIASQAGRAEASNNLARLYLLHQEEKAPDTEAAIFLLNRGIDQLKKDPPDVGTKQIRYSLYKNLGWARLQQGRLIEAQEALKKAIALQPKPAAAHCLLGQTLMQLGQNEAAIAAWANCTRERSKTENLEEDMWVYQAEQALRRGP